ncbi:RNA polymerase sigma factor [Psychrobacillus vulpis]|uniref:Sigma-70 family RNA polymerase sigma factor n=1 Tax=Psychrobacillus vulpis TaxID=2325572 RepID=A0A544TTN0_9BACI|nr:sigma-70 family RNA polymerase sigma factor [Psychrobacillus vulpis]TQR20803.1 sigma-70 family RNA polymerase sigma factor [Psychrobacillus vulpis]
MFDFEGSISEIYKNHYLDVYRFLICFSGDQSDAEDMTQEVFIRVLNNISLYNSSYNLKTWIFAIAKHVAVDHYRKKRFTTFFKDGFFNQLISTDKGPNELMEQSEMKKLVHEAISMLKPNYRMVVILRGINEFSIKDTSQILQCSESKVKVDYHRALKILKNKLFLDAKEVVGNAN